VSRIVPKPPVPPSLPPGLYAPEAGGAEAGRPERPEGIPPIPPGMYAPETGGTRDSDKR
jgi:hypothetical protein